MFHTHTHTHKFIIFTQHIHNTKKNTQRLALESKLYFIHSHRV